MPSIPQTIANAAQAAGIPPALALQVAVQESELNPNARGRAGELGLFQLMPSTAAQYGVTNPLDPVENAAAGTQYLADLYDQFGSWPAALTAFNWGPGNLTRAGGNLAAAPASTQAYVAQALGGAGAPSAVSVTPGSIAAGAVQAATDAAAAVDANAAAIDESGVLLTPAMPNGSAPWWIWLALAALGVYIAADLLGEA